MLNHVLYYIGVTALVLVGLIVAISAFVSIFASIRNSRAESAAQSAADEPLTDDTNNHNDVQMKEVEEQ